MHLWLTIQEFAKGASRVMNGNRHGIAAKLEATDACHASILQFHSGFYEASYDLNQAFRLDLTPATYQLCAREDYLNNLS